MMFLLAVAAAVLPLVPIAADDARLQDEDTFVSPNAKAELASDTDERVLCLDRHRVESICLTETEWNKAIKLAETAPKKAPGAFIPNGDNGTSTGSTAMLYGRSR